MNYSKDPKIKKLIKAALAEDIGKGDITNEFLCLEGKKVQAIISAGSKGIVCGLDIARLAFKLLDKSLKFNALVKDGKQIRKGEVIAKINGKASSILSAERVALNFLGLLSGISTRTAEFVKRVRDYNLKIMDTRKTLPGLRQLQKYAVRLGGGHNHRFRLDEMIFIKDNHLEALGNRLTNLKCMLTKVSRKAASAMKIEIEVTNLQEFRFAIKVDPDIIMLDNMSVSQVKRAVEIRDRLAPKLILETSGNIDLKNIRAYAQAGVDIISLGTLTKDIRCLDLSLGIRKGG
ncbi:MAG: carboxylating nicotinate-nucleotide diphosphorylase [Candidatus Omnitrophota bacterium]|jgi:nicotinate-nucleotide pyrophosphorylase (carboxylating)